MKKYQKFLFLFLALFTISFMGFVGADSGWDSSYSSGSSSSSSSSSDYSSSSGGGISIDLGIDDVFVIPLMIVVFIFFGFCYIKIASKIYRISSLSRAKRRFNKLYSIVPSHIVQIKEILPNFDEQVFKDEVFEIYKNIQIAWMNFNYNSLREYTTDELYNMYYSQLETLSLQKQKNIMSEFKLHDFKIISMEHDEKSISLKVRVMIECYDMLLMKIIK